MHSGLLASIGLVGLLMASPAFASDAGCCADKTQASHASHTCCDMPCCKDHGPAVETNTVALSIDTTPLPLLVGVVPARQATVVWFHQPVRIGENILQGRYVIEHDNDRMAAGGPCTYIYAFEDQKIPVVAFHCVHLDREAREKGTVVLHRGSDGFLRLDEFQFPGDPAGHGMPTVR